MNLIELIMSGDFMPHGHCFLWRRDLLILHVGGDIVTAGAYFAIPAALVQLVRKRADLAFNWMILMFALFIFCCGVTHILDTVNIWNGYYYLEGIAKLATGGVSVITAVLIWRLLPKALAFPSHAELLEKNSALQAAEERLLAANEDLEERVRERTLELQRLASTDPLTGVSNRRALLERLDAELERNQRYGHPLSLLLIDLDDFKQLNDQHGHTAGDDVLIETARRFDEQCRTSDLLGRYGGEEFMVLLPETGEEEATQFAQRLVDRARENAIDTVGGDLVVTSSVGVAEAREDETAASLIDRADAAMYQAKSLGKARVHVSE